MAFSRFDLSELLDALRAGGDVDVIRSSVEMLASPQPCDALAQMLRR
ncbi:MAG: hypothetical protein ACXV7I_06405 [Ilumatobacteraceae bacterium]